jgi:hypothetical protein
MFQNAVELAERIDAVPVRADVSVLEGHLGTAWYASDGKLPSHSQATRIIRSTFRALRSQYASPYVSSV